MSKLVGCILLFLLPLAGWSQKESTDEIALLQKEIQQQKLAKDSIGAVRSYLQLAKHHEINGNYDTAIHVYQQAAGYLAANDELTAYLLNSMYQLGDLLQGISRQKAVKSFQALLNISQNVKDTIYQVYTLLQLGDITDQQNDRALQEKYLVRAEHLSFQSGNPELEAMTYSWLAQIYEQQGDYIKSQTATEKALDAYEKGDSENFISILLQYSLNKTSVGEIEKAVEGYERAIKHARSGDDPILLGEALGASSFAYNLIGDFDKARAVLDEAHSVFMSVGNKVHLAFLMQQKAQYYKEVGDFEASIKSYLQGDSILLAEKRNADRHPGINNIGVTYFHQADYKKALEYFYYAADLKGLADIDESYILYRNNMAECLFHLKDFRKADSILNDIYPRATSLKLDRVNSYITLVMGKIGYELKNYAKAEKFLSEAVSYAEKTKEKGRMVESVTQLSKVQTALGKRTEAEQSLLKAVQTARKYRIITYGWEALYELGLLYFRENQLEKAIPYFQEAIAIVEQAATRLYGGESAVKSYKSEERKSDLYNKLIAALAKTGRDEESMTYAVKSNIAALNATQGSSKIAVSDPEINSALQKATALQQQKALVEKTLVNIEEPNSPEALRLKNKIEVLEKDYINFINALVLKYPGIAERFSEKIKPTDLKNLKNKMPADMASILYIINEQQLLIFTVTRERFKLTMLETGEDFDKLITDFLASLENPASTITRSGRPAQSTSNTIPFAETSQRLYALLIEEILPEIRTKKQLCIIPSGRLANIPFQALSKKSTNEKTTFLLEEFNLFHTNSLDIFGGGTASQKDLSSFAAYGDPDKTLSNAKLEVFEIARILKLNTKVDIYVDERATEENVKIDLEKKRYVHIATHGVLNYNAGTQDSSYLVFAGTANPEGKLYLSEINELALHECELVTLSACKTAVTQQMAKGWYISPANTFLTNGAKSVVASLWNVDDRATSILMGAFYRNMKTMSKSEALTKAQIEVSLLPEFKHPFYWAAFALYGDWR